MVVTPVSVTGGLTISKSLGSISSVFVKSTNATGGKGLTSVGVSGEKVISTFASFNLFFNSASSLAFNSGVYVPKDTPVPKTLLIDVPDLTRASSN